MITLLRAAWGRLTTWWTAWRWAIWLALLLASNAWTAYTVDQYVRDRALVRVQQRELQIERAHNAALEAAAARADAAVVSYQQEHEKNAAMARKQAATALAVARPDHECLSALLVRQLRDSPDAGLRAGAGGAAAGPGAAAADPGNDAARSSEADITDWIGRVREQYDGCRGQVLAFAALKPQVCARPP